MPLNKSSQPNDTTARCPFGLLIVKLFPGDDFFKGKLSQSCFGELLSQESFKSRTCDSIEKPWRLKLMF